jgi:RimJ/RimL family protein N-acetyltransferase
MLRRLGLVVGAVRYLKRRLAPRQTVVTYRLVAATFQPVPLPEAWKVATTTDPFHVGSRPSNETCHVLSIDGQVVGCGFSSIPPDASWHIGETGTILNMPAGAMLLTAFRTVPAMQGRGVYSALLSSILRDFFASGGHEAYIGAVEGNHASHAVIRKLGFRLHEVHRPSRQGFRSGS